MTEQSLEARVDRLEQRMDAVEAPPTRIDGLEMQIVQLRSEMTSEFSAVHAEIGALDARTKKQGQELSAQMRMLHEDLVERIKTIKRG